MQVTCVNSRGNLFVRDFVHPSRSGATPWNATRTPHIISMRYCSLRITDMLTQWIFVLVELLSKICWQKEKRPYYVWILRRSCGAWGGGGVLGYFPGRPWSWESEKLLYSGNVVVVTSHCRSQDELLARGPPRSYTCTQSSLRRVRRTAKEMT